MGSVSTATPPPKEFDQDTAHTEVSTTVVGGGGLVLSEDPWTRAGELNLIAPTGEYVGPVDANGDPLIFEPIRGYGTFADVDYFVLDWQELNARLATCIKDQRFPVELHSDGLGISYQRVPPEQNQLALAATFACREGIGQPERRPFTRAEWSETYEYVLAVAECLRGQGCGVGKPPTLDVFIESEGGWSGYNDVPNLSGQAWDDLNAICPQAPQGGFGAWDPGDPIAAG